MAPMRLMWLTRSATSDALAAKAVEGAIAAEHRVLNNFIRVVWRVRKPSGQLVGCVHVRRGQGLEAMSMIVHQNPRLTGVDIYSLTKLLD
jgi:hypothetical protein